MQEGATTIEQEQVLQWLTDRKIPYTVTGHAPVFTIEEMEQAGIPHSEDICKNLFLRDDKGRRHFLVVMDKNKKADLRALQAQLGCSRLGFASEQRLGAYLQLKKGTVTPLGILSDAAHAVEVVLDRDLLGRERLGVHPCVNTATVWLSCADLLRVIEQNGNTLHIVDISV